MVEIGGRPILWHIMKMYSNHGIKDFVVCLGYKGYLVKEYFFNYYRHTSDFTINLATGDYKILDTESEDWTITFVDTGPETQTGGRLKRVAEHLQDETFCLTYGDGVSDINLTQEIEFHKSHGKLATIAAVRPPGRFASLTLGNSGVVNDFREKPEDEVGLINGGFFVLEPGIFDLLESDSDIWEGRPLQDLAGASELVAFEHNGFWQPMDTLREKRMLEDLFKRGAPWL